MVGKVCAAINIVTIDEAVDDGRIALSEGAQVLEYRLDKNLLYKDMEKYLRALDRLYPDIKNPRKFEIISTNMTKAESGDFEGSPKEWATVLRKTIAFHTDYVTVGTNMAKTEEGKGLCRYAAENNSRIILSHHDQSGMPDPAALIEILEGERYIAKQLDVPFIAKVACMATKPEEVLYMMEATLHEMTDINGNKVPKIMIAMGSSGSDWRPISLREPWNCHLNYFAINQQKRTAKGQLTVKQGVAVLRALEG